MLLRRLLLWGRRLLLRRLHLTRLWLRLLLLRRRLRRVLIGIWRLLRKALMLSLRRGMRALLALRRRRSSDLWRQLNRVRVRRGRRGTLRAGTRRYL